MKDLLYTATKKTLSCRTKEQNPEEARSLGTVFYKSPLINAREIKFVTDQKQSGTLANHKRKWPRSLPSTKLSDLFEGGGCTQASYLARLQPQSGPAHNYARNSTTGTVHAESSYPGLIREKPRNEHVIANFVGTLMGEGFFH